jgi:hypothetical protein
MIFRSQTSSGSFPRVAFPPRPSSCRAPAPPAASSAGSASTTGANNVTFSVSKWTKDVGSGEALRDGYDETMALDPRNVRYIYQGHDPFTSATGNSIP